MLSIDILYVNVKIRELIVYSNLYFSPLKILDLQKFVYAVWVGFIAWEPKAGSNHLTVGSEIAQKFAATVYSFFKPIQDKSKMPACSDY